MFELHTSTHAAVNAVQSFCGWLKIAISLFWFRWVVGEAQRPAAAAAAAAVAQWWCYTVHKCDAFPFHFVPEIALSNAYRIQIHSSI